VAENLLRALSGRAEGRNGRGTLPGADARGSSGGGEESRPEETLMVSDCLPRLLPRGYPAGLMGAGDGGERHPCGREQADTTGKEGPSASCRPARRLLP